MTKTQVKITLTFTLSNPKNLDKEFTLNSRKNHFKHSQPNTIWRRGGMKSPPQNYSKLIRTCDWSMHSRRFILANLEKLNRVNDIVALNFHPTYYQHYNINHTVAILVSSLNSICITDILLRIRKAPLGSWANFDQPQRQHVRTF